MSESSTIYNDFRNSDNGLRQPNASGSHRGIMLVSKGDAWISNDLTAKRFELAGAGNMPTPFMQQHGAGRTDE